MHPDAGYYSNLIKNSQNNFCVEYCLTGYVSLIFSETILVIYLSGRNKINQRTHRKWSENERKLFLANAEASR